MGESLNANKTRKAIVKNLVYLEPEDEMEIEEIYLETEDGLKTSKNGWYINKYYLHQADEFRKTRDDFLAGKIKKGTEVTIEYNQNGIVAFWL